MDSTALDEIFDDHEENRPAGQVDTAPPTTTTTEEKPESPPPGDQSRNWDKYRDKYGRKFDPEYHRTDANGEPRINKRDGFLSIRPGKGKPPSKPGPAVTAAGDPAALPAIDLDAGPGPGGDPAPAGPSMEESNQAAFMALKMVEGGLVNVLGPAWAFRSQTAEIGGQEIEVNEIETFQQPLARMLNDQGVGDLPPGLALCAASMMYVSARMGDEKAAGQVKGAFNWIKRKIKGAFTWCYLRFKRA